MARAPRIVTSATISGALISLISLICFATEAYAQQGPFWKTIKPGPFGVGYTVYHEWDGSRAYRPAGGSAARAAVVPIARPIQISVWYPAPRARNEKRMDLIDYLYAGLSQFEFERAGTIPRDAFIVETKAILMKRGADERRVNEVLSAPSRAVRDAPWSGGPFPVIVYGAGYESSAWENFVLCEYLASYGFIVAASPSFGANGVKMTGDFADLEAKVRDHEFVMAFAKCLPHADAERIGALGWSFGGLSTAICAMRNGFVRAAVCLDGSMAYPAGREAARAHPDYNPASLAVPFMYCSQRDTDHRDLGFFEKLVRSDGWLIEFANLAHEDFAARFIASDVYMMGDAAPRDAAAAIAAHETMCRYVLAFFRASLLADAEAAAFLTEDPSQHGAMATVRRKVALPPDRPAGSVGGSIPAADEGAAILERFAGEYEAEGTIVRVEIDGRRLLFHIPGQAPHEYVYEGGRTFRHLKFRDFTLVFLVDADGAVTGVVSHQGYADFVLKRT